MFFRIKNYVVLNVKLVSHAVGIVELLEVFVIAGVVSVLIVTVVGVLLFVVVVVAVVIVLVIDVVMFVNVSWSVDFNNY